MQTKAAADNWASTLETKYDFAITRLVERESTKAAVEAACFSAAAELEAGDAFVLIYVGHGGRHPDSWSADLDEADGYDEGPALPVEGEEDTYQLWIDDRIREVLGAFVPGVKITCVFDTCNSGTSTRVARPRSISEEAMNHLLFSSCTATGTALVVGGGTIFELYARRALEKSGTGITAKGFYDRLYALGAEYSYFPQNQDPQLEGPESLKNSRLFV